MHTKLSLLLSLLLIARFVGAEEDNTAQKSSISESSEELTLAQNVRTPDSQMGQMPPLTLADSQGVVEFEPMVVRDKYSPNSLPGNYDQFTHEIKQLPYNTSIITRMEIDRTRFVDPDELLDRIPGESQTRNLRIPNGGKSYTIPLLDGVAQGSPYRGATQDFAFVGVCTPPVQFLKKLDIFSI